MHDAAYRLVTVGMLPASPFERDSPINQGPSPLFATPLPPAWWGPLRAGYLRGVECAALFAWGGKECFMSKTDSLRPVPDKAPVNFTATLPALERGTSWFWA